MGQQKATTDAKIDALRSLVNSGDKPASIHALRDALKKEKSNFLVAKAAEWCSQQLYYELIPDLANAYPRFLKNALKTDKTCAAKRAIARALYDLDYDNERFFQRGLHYQQREPVWGGHIDTAVELRCCCALGLAAGTNPRATLLIIELLHDEEPPARLGAIKAMEMIQPFNAEIALRNKILQGDPEPEVITQCFSSLMKVAADDSLEFVGNFLQDADEFKREAALLALGECRLDEALNMLIALSEQLTSLDRQQQTVFRAIALQRKEKAFNHLLAVVEEADQSSAVNAIIALAIYNFNDDLRAKIEARVAQRKSTKLLQTLEKYWQ